MSDATAQPTSATPVRDIGARALWTLAEAGLASLILWVTQFDVSAYPAWAAVLVTAIASFLSVIKSYIGTKVGNPKTVTFS